MNLNETIYNSNHIMGVEELSANTREIPFNQLMTEFCDDYDSSDNCENFAVVWKEYHGELQVEQIYNHPTHWAYINGEMVAHADVANIPLESIESVILTQAIVGGSY